MSVTIDEILLRSFVALIGLTSMTNFAVAQPPVVSADEDSVERAPKHERPIKRWAPASAYFYPDEDRRIRLLLGINFPRPRESTFVTVRLGTSSLEIAAEHITAEGLFPLSDLNSGQVSVSGLRIGRVFGAWALGAEVGLVNVWDRPGLNAEGLERGETSIGVGPYIRFGTSRGLHLRIGAWLGWSFNVNEFALPVYAQLQLPILRHRSVELDLVGRVWAGGSDDLYVFGLVDLRALIADLIVVGVGWRRRGIALSLGVEL